jgi:D-alanyl-D-alanine carboxypeptidase
MRLKYLMLFVYVYLSLSVFGQKKLNSSLDSVLSSKQSDPFSGVVLISEKGKQQYFKTFGFADLNQTVKVKANDKFVIGSISKQITAVLILQLYEKGKIKLTDPISKYLAIVPSSWDTITIDQLLSHTSGIVRLEKPLAFKPGSKFMYSQHGYELLAQITEKVTNTSFAEQSLILFNKCQMKNSCHPSFLKEGEPVTCFTKQINGAIVIETKSLESFPAAGAFVSSAGDLALWNKCLFGGKLINDSTLKIMVTRKRNAVRDHPIFGKTYYGYGITMDSTDGIDQYGQTGFADGFASMDFYFPASQTSVIALENIVYNPDDMKKTFYYHTQILNIVRKNMSEGKR